MRVVASFLLSLLLCLPVSAHNWAPVIAQVERSIVRVTAEEAIEDDVDGGILFKTCTGFTINKKQNYVLTAAHCLGDENSLKVDDMPSFVVKADYLLDLAIAVNLATPGRPSLKPSRKVAMKGLPVAALGFGYGEEALTSKTGAIMAPRFVWSVSPLRTYFLTDFSLIGGMSGGPIVDSDGRVMSINQKTDPTTSTGLGRPLYVLRGFAGGFWD